MRSWLAVAAVPSLDTTRSFSRRLPGDCPRMKSSKSRWYRLPASATTPMMMAMTQAMSSRPAACSPIAAGSQITAAMSAGTSPRASAAKSRSTAQ